jgi:hypothetical protein
VLSSPPDKTSAAQRPAVLMWNVGVNPRVGPYRVNVELARRLAAAGFVALRFDTSGLGDSEARHDGPSDSESVELDLADAMAAVTRRTGIERFVVLGFCSSVDAAHRVAVKDARVVGVVHLEGYAFRTPGFYRRLPLRLLSRERWKRRLRHTGNVLRAVASGGPVPTPVVRELVFQRDYPAWEDFSRELAELTTRGVYLLFVYVGLDTDFNHPNQFWEMFGSRELDRSRVDLDYFPSADHVFFDVDSRAKMMARVLQFMLRRFGTQ